MKKGVSASDINDKCGHPGQPFVTDWLHVTNLHEHLNTRRDKDSAEAEIQQCSEYQHQSISSVNKLNEKPRL
ncbi:Hypothetical protein NTJ_06647 [Nesidiocoris tenuis]|uniref:Uncharacterized protein n=1 Tax=Nesidiocoris tenuis TaxID=355587 RepID=A0ABN7ANN6_9HEMI|nr:Hypothetical protein NTJ_06647 [Nesidiocoris tenuis]